MAAFGVPELRPTSTTANTHTVPPTTGASAAVREQDRIAPPALVAMPPDRSESQAMAAPPAVCQMSRATLATNMLMPSVVRFHRPPVTVLVGSEPRADRKT